MSAATISAISPSNGPTAGGTPVTITGTNFTAAPAVTFNSVAATSIVVVSSTSITCVAPASATTGLATVVVPATGGNASNNALFTYEGIATVTPAYSAGPGAGALSSEVNTFGGELRLLAGSFSFDSVYTPGGEQFSIAGYFRQIIGVLFPKVGGYSFEYIPATGLVKAYVAAGTEVTGGNLGLTIPFLAVGI